MSRPHTDSPLPSPVAIGGPVQYEVIRETQLSAQNVRHMIATETGKFAKKPPVLTNPVTDEYKAYCGENGPIFNEVAQNPKVTTIAKELPSAVTQFQLIALVHLINVSGNVQDLKWEMIDADTGYSQTLYNPFHSGGAVNIGGAYQQVFITGTLDPQFQLSPGTTGEVLIRVTSTKSVPRGGVTEVPNYWDGCMNYSLMVY